LFNDCAFIQNVLLDYDGIKNCEACMKKARFSVDDDTFDVTSANIQNSQLMDDILFNGRFIEFHSSDQSDRDMTTESALSFRTSTLGRRTRRFGS
jgi:hypothetical protein